MGQSTDAILIYGIPVPDWEDRRSFDEKVFKAMPGYPQLVEKAKRHAEEYDDLTFEEHLENLNDVWEYGQMVCGGTPFRFESHQSSSCPMWIVGLAEHRHRAWRGHIVKIPEGIEIPESLKVSLIDFCKQHKIPIGDDEPAWLLVSDWGV